MTHCGHKPGRNTAPQQSPAVPRSAMLFSEAREVLVVNRRSFITLLGGAAAWPLAARAQQSGRSPRVGVLVSASPPHPFADAFWRGLRPLGYSEGRNIAVEF